MCIWSSIDDIRCVILRLELGQYYERTIWTPVCLLPSAPLLAALTQPSQWCHPATAVFARLADVFQALVRALSFSMDGQHVTWPKYFSFRACRARLDHPLLPLLRVGLQRRQQWVGMISLSHSHVYPLGHYQPVCVTCTVPGYGQQKRPCCNHGRGFQLPTTSTNRI